MSLSAFRSNFIELDFKLMATFVEMLEPIIKIQIRYGNQFQGGGTRRRQGKRGTGYLRRDRISFNCIVCCFVFGALFFVRTHLFMFMFAFMFMLAFLTLASIYRVGIMNKSCPQRRLVRYDAEHVLLCLRVSKRSHWWTRQLARLYLARLQHQVKLFRVRCKSDAGPFYPDC